MGRPSSPWYWQARSAWAVEIDGRRYVLAKGPKSETRAAARDAFHKLMAERAAVGGTLRGRMKVNELCDTFMDHVARDLKPSTFQFYLRHLRSFVALHGDRKVTDVRPHHVTEWTNAQGWAQGTRRGAITAVQTAFAWGRRQGYIDSNPIVDLDKPSPVVRDKILSREQADLAIASVDEHFSRLLEFLRETGARPGEAARLTRAEVDWERGIAVIQDHKTETDTGKPRVIVLSQRAVEILKELAERHPEGPLFLNAKGNPWSRHAMAQAFARLRKKTGLGPEATAHAFRHRFATDALVTQPNAIVARLLGHSGTAIVDRVYNHLRDEIDALRKAIDQVRPGPKNT